MTIGFAALVGLPPLVGFFSKDDVLGVAAEQAFDGAHARGWLVLVAGLAVAALTAAYSTRAWLMTFFGPRRGDQTGVVPRESGWLMLGPLVVLAGCIAAGRPRRRSAGLPRRRPRRLAPGWSSWSPSRWSSSGSG